MRAYRQFGSGWWLSHSTQFLITAAITCPFSGVPSFTTTTTWRLQSASASTGSRIFYSGLILSSNDPSASNDTGFCSIWSLRRENCLRKKLNKSKCKVNNRRKHVVITHCLVENVMLFSRKNNFFFVAGAIKSRKYKNVTLSHSLTFIV